MEFVKLKKKSKEFFNIMDGKSKVANYPNRSTMNHQSFRGSPLPNTFKGRGQSSYFNSQRNRNQNRNNRIGKSNLFPFFYTKPNSSFNCSGLPQSSSVSNEFIQNQNKGRNSFGRKNETFPRELETVNTRSFNLRNSAGIQNSIYRVSSTNFFAKKGKLNKQRKRACGSRDKSNAHEGCYFKSKTISRSVLEQHLHSPKKGWREQTSYKSETSKQLY